VTTLVRVHTSVGSLPFDRCCKANYVVLMLYSSSNMIRNTGGLGYGKVYSMNSVFSVNEI